MKKEINLDFKNNPKLSSKVRNFINRKPVQNKKEKKKESIKVDLVQLSIMRKNGMPMYRILQQTRISKQTYLSLFEKRLPTYIFLGSKQSTYSDDECFFGINLVPFSDEELKIKINPLHLDTNFKTLSNEPRNEQRRNYVSSNDNAKTNGN